MRMRSSTSAKLGAALMAGTLVLAACGSDSTSSATTAAGATETTAAAGATDTTAAAGGTDTTAAAGAGLADLAAACTAEKKVNLIALPDEWAMALVASVSAVQMRRCLEA